MIGIVDSGGGMRAIYASGVYDSFMDAGFVADYCVSISAGSANSISYVAGQRGRAKDFFMNYTFKKPGFLSVKNFLKTGNYINLDYIFSTLSNEDGESPLDYDAMLASPTKYKIFATDADTGEARAWMKEDFVRNDYRILKASCALPLVCKPVEIDGVEYYDGGLSEPIPVETAFADGCDKVIAVLTKPVPERKKEYPIGRVVGWMLKGRMKIGYMLQNMGPLYNSFVDKLVEYEKQGKCIIIAPESRCGVSTLTKDKEGYQKLYDAGYKDGMAALQKLKEQATKV